MINDKNSEKGEIVKKAAVTFILLLGLGFSYGLSRKLTDLPQVTNPISIEIADHELYVLDDVVVYVYAMKDFQFQRKFGKKGEGLGQLMPNSEVPLAMNIADDYVYLNSQIKMIKFSKAGVIIKEQRIPFSFQTIPVGKNYVSIKINATHDIQSFNVTHYDSDFSKPKPLYSRERIPRSRLGHLPIPPELIILRSHGDKFFLFDQRKGLDIDVYDSRGNPLKPIKMDYPKIKVTDSFKKETEAWFRAQPSFRMAAEELRGMISFPDYLPVMRNFLIKDGKLYIQTYKTQNHLSEFIILDLDGNLKKRTFLPGFKNSLVQFDSSTIFTFSGGKYYYLVEQETGWEIHAEDVEEVK